MTQPSSLRRLGRHGAVYATGILLNKLVSFVMLPVYTRYLTTADYGTIQLVDLTIEVVSIAAGSRLAAGVFPYYHKADDERGRHAVISTALAIMALTFGGAALATILFAPGISRLVFESTDQTLLLRLGAARLGFDCFVTVPLAYLQLRERSGTVIAVSSARLLLQLVLNIWFIVVMRTGATGVLLSNLIASVVVGTGLAVYVLSRTGVRYESATARALLRFGLPFVLTQSAQFIATYGDRYFLKRAADVGAVGVYALAYQFGFLLTSVASTPFTTAWDPMRFEVAKQADRDRQFSRAFLYLNLIVLSGSVALALFVHDFLAVASAPPFRPAADIVPVILAAYVFQAWTNFHNVGLFITDRPHLITWANWIGAGVAVAGYLLLIPRYYGMGAAWATVLAFAVREIVIYDRSQRVWPLAYEWGPVIRLVAIATGIVVVDQILPVDRLLPSLALHVALSAVYLGLVWLFVLGEGERALARSGLRRPREILSSLRTSRNAAVS